LEVQVPNNRLPRDTIQTLQFERCEQSFQLPLPEDVNDFEEKWLSDVSEEVAYKTEGLKERLSIVVGRAIIG